MRSIPQALLIKVLYSALLLPRILFSQTYSVLPDSAEGWISAGNPEVYAGDDLYKLINGGADIFHEYGFNKVITQKYFNDDRIISVEAYEMLDSSSAFGIFSLITFNTGKPVKFNTDAYAGDEYFLFQKGKYYISLSGSESSRDIQTGLFLLAGAIEKNIEQSGKPDLVNKFNQLKYSGISYIKGNLGFYNLKVITPGKGFKVEEGIAIKDERSTDIILMYKSDEECSRNFQSLIGNLKEKSDSDFSEQNDGTLIINKEGKSYFIITSAENFIIISYSADKPNAEESIKEIRSFLQ